MSFPKGFFIGAATAAHQVEGNNIHSDYWAQEQLPHTSFTEPSGDACSPSPAEMPVTTTTALKKTLNCWPTPA